MMGLVLTEKDPRELPPPPPPPHHQRTQARHLAGGLPAPGAARRAFLSLISPQCSVFVTAAQAGMSS